VLRTPKARRDDEVTEGKARAALSLVGLFDPDRPAAALTAHEQRLLMLASALATQPRVLLLDEPAAGASATELDRLAELLDELRDSGLALLVIEHNLRFVRRVADQVTVLEAGRRIASGTLAEVATDENVRAAYLGRQSLS
jgi:branched-chain amino acid transport system ATP-binding protein